MNITPPNVGNHRSHSNHSDYANRNTSNTQSATTNVATTPIATNETPTTIAPVGAAAPVEKPAFDAEALAKSILSYVQQRLAKEADAGASKDELAALLKQAREGVTAGFNQATKELKDSGELTDALSSGISSALQKVDSGFDDLEKQLGLNSDAAVNTNTPSKKTLTTNTATDTQTNVPASQTDTLGQLAVAYQTRFSSKQSVDLVVRTADGDTVHLQLGVKQKQSFGAAYQVDANGQQLSVYSREKSSGRLNISVDGDLDADEMQALGDLLNQVGDLADSFFSGDMDAALAKAGTLDLSNPELSAMSLDLRSEVTTRSKIAAYAAVQSLADEPASDTASTSAPLGLGDLVDALSSLMPQASIAKNPANLLKEFLAAQLAATNQENNPLLEFANRLLDALGADATDETAIPTPTVPASTEITPTSNTPATNEQPTI